MWKTTDAGGYWENVSDGFFGRASVGALAISPSDRNVLYAGMGEACIRSTVSHGDGVYRSTDGGASWQHAGLRDSRHIGKIRIDPRDPDVVFVAALGHANGENAERGVYRSRDGGRTWSQVLGRGTRAGAVDVTIDTHNPRVVYATTWETIRTPWVISSGGPGSGVFRSVDGGDTWTDLSAARGFPRGMLGRIGISASPAQEGRIYAVVEAAEGGIFRSDDQGESWVRGAADRSLWYRSYYYQHVTADPRDPDTVWALNQDCWRSVDAGLSFQRVATPHGDNHDLWIDPGDTRRMIVGCDGGAAVSCNRGATWSSIHNQPTAELYHVAVDTRVPYRLYAAQQDCGTISLPSRSMLGAITDHEAHDVGGGESGYVAVRPDDPDVAYSGQFSGYLTRYDHRTGQSRNIEVWPEVQAWGLGAKHAKYRWTWSYPIVLSPHDPNTLYVAANHVFRSTDEGTTWQRISPDLSRRDRPRIDPPGSAIQRDVPATERESVGTVFSFAESPKAAGVLWAGTDDGRVQLSRDAGRAWRDVTPPGVAPWTLVSAVEPSPHDAAVAYVAATRYLLDEHRPMLFRTRDHGRSWSAIGAGIPADELSRVIREDPECAGLLFCGTETGAYASLDDGAHWERLGGGLPVVPVHDLAIKDGDLVAATHGRGFWILDDLTALRQEFARNTRTRAHLFAPRPVTRFQSGGRYLKAPLAGHNYRIEGATTVAWTPLVRPGERAEHYFNAGRNPPEGAVIRYWLPEDASGDVVLSFRDATGHEVSQHVGRDGAREPSPPRTKGLNRFVWDLRHRGPVPVADAGGEGRAERGAAGPFVAPGRYDVRLSVAGHDLRAELEVRADPRTGASAADLDAQLALLLRLRDLVSVANTAMNDLRAARTRLEGIACQGPVRGSLSRALDQVTRLELEIAGPPGGRTAGRFSPPALGAKLAGLSARVASADAAPTRASEQLAVALGRQVGAIVARVDVLVRHDLPLVERSGPRAPRQRTKPARRV